MYRSGKLEREDDLALIATHTKSHVAYIEKGISLFYNILIYFQ